MPFELRSIPPPDAILEVSYETYVANMLEHLRLLNEAITTTKESDPLYSVLQVIAYQITIKTEEINNAVRAVLLPTSSGNDLDNLGAIYQEPRRILSEGDNTVNPPIEEVRESDIDYRNRLLTAFKSLALGSREWYKKLILESGSPFETTVKDLQVLGPEDSDDVDIVDPDDTNITDIMPGDIWCYIEAISDITPIPSQTLIDQVEKYLDRNTLPDGSEPRALVEERRFLGDTINVRSCIQKPYTVSVRFRENPGLDFDTVKQNLQIIALDFVIQFKRIGEKIPLSAIYSVLDTDEVFELDIDYPKQNIIPKLNEIPIASFPFELQSNEYVSGITWDNFSDQSGSKWSIIDDNNSKQHLVFTKGISLDDKIQLDGVGAGRKFDILGSSGGLDDIKLSGQISNELSEDSGHYHLELLQNVSKSTLTAGTLYVYFRSSIDINKI